MRIVITIEALTKEYPWPSIVAIKLDLRKSGGKKTTKSSGQRSSAIEETNAPYHLMTAVEHGKVDDDATKQAALEHAEEESAGHKAAKGLCEANKGTSQTPQGDESRQVDAAFYALVLLVQSCCLLSDRLTLTSQLLGTSTRMYGT